MDDDKELEAADAAVMKDLAKELSATDHGPTESAPAKDAGKTQAAPEHGGEKEASQEGEVPSLGDFLKAETAAPDAGAKGEAPAEVKEWAQRLSRQATELDKRMKGLDALEAKLKAQAKGEDSEGESEEEVDLEDLSPFERRQYKELQALKARLENLAGEDATSRQARERQEMELRFDAALGEAAKKHNIRHVEVLEGFLSRAPEGATIEQVAKYLARYYPHLCKPKAGAERKSSILDRGGERPSSAVGSKPLTPIGGEGCDEAVKEIFTKMGE